MTFISQSHLQSIEGHLAGRLAELLTADGPETSNLDALAQRVSGYVLRGGKRIRPQLCVWSYLAAGGTTVDTNVLDVASAWEIFHAFLLVHDDLIDVADTRRQTPSLHRQLQSLDHDSPAFGENLAIVAGDLLFGVSIRLLAEMNIDPAVQVQLLRLFSRIACTTGFGQAIDIFQSKEPLNGVSETVLMREYDWKTAAYTFEGPLLSGAILAGASTATQSTLSRFARAIGQAYQLQNDLADLSQPAHDGCDLIQGKRTVTLMHARAGMTADRRQMFDSQLDALATANGQAVAQAETLRMQVRRSGAIEMTGQTIHKLLGEARSSAADSAICPSLSLLLIGLTDSLEKCYFATAD